MHYKDIFCKKKSFFILTIFYTNNLNCPQTRPVATATCSSFITRVIRSFTKKYIRTCYFRRVVTFLGMFYLVDVYLVPLWHNQKLSLENLFRCFAQEKIAFFRLYIPLIELTTDPPSCQSYIFQFHAHAISYNHTQM